MKTIDKGVHLYSFITYKYDKYGNLIEARDASGNILLRQEFGISCLKKELSLATIQVKNN